MRLKEIHIHRQYSYAVGAQQGPLVGKITFESPTGEMTLQLTDKISEKLLAVLADELVEVAKDTAQIMRSQVIESVPALPALESGE